MSRFDQILRGKKARKTIDLPVPLGAYEPGKVAERIPVDLVVLSGDEEAQALEAAHVYAKTKGSDEPKHGDPHYDLGLMVHTLFLACVDHDDSGSFLRFFDSAQQILENFDRDRITYVYQLQQIWQDECSPWGKADDEDQILSKLVQLEGVLDPGRPFEMWRLATVGSLLLTTVKRLAALQRDRSPSGTFGAGATSRSTSSHVGSA